MSYAKHMIRAMTYRGNRWTHAWFMGRASFAYSRAHGLTLREAVPPAWALFRSELRREQEPRT